MISIRWTPVFPPLEKWTIRTPTNRRRSFWCLGGVRTQKKKAKQPLILYHQKQRKPFSTKFDWCFFCCFLVSFQFLGRTFLHLFWGSPGSWPVIRRFPPKLCHLRSRWRRSPLRRQRAPRRRRQRPTPRGRWRCSFWGISVWPVSNPKKIGEVTKIDTPGGGAWRCFFPFGCFRLQITMRICQVQSSAVQPSPVQPSPVQPPPVLTEAYEAARSLGRIGGCLDCSWSWWWDRKSVV